MKPGNGSPQDFADPGAPPGLIAFAHALGGQHRWADVAGVEGWEDSSTPAEPTPAPPGGYRGKSSRRAPSALTSRVEAAAERIAGPEARRPSGRSANLDNGTHKCTSAEFPAISAGKPVEEQLGAKVTKYRDGVRVTIFRGRRVPGTREKLDSPSKLPDVERSARSKARSKQLVVDRVRRLGATALWTFTKRGKFSSQDEVWTAWRRFLRGARKRYPGNWRSVEVPELHSDGVSWHLHVAVAEFYSVEALRILWYRALGGTGRERGEETPGSVNVKAGRNNRASARGFARYIAKYIGKGFERSATNRRVFGSSGDIEAADVRYWRSPYDGSIAEFARAVNDWLQAQLGTRHCFPRFITRTYGEFAIIEVPYTSTA